MFFNGLFSKSKDREEKKLLSVGGKIEYFGLINWWLNDLTEEERQIIRDTYKPVTASVGGGYEEIFIDEGNIASTTETKLGFIGGLIGWFKKFEHYEIAKKIIDLAEKNINDKADILDIHFCYLNCIKVHYKNRDNDTDSLDKAIEYCKKQISISEQSKKAFLNNKYFGFLPSHTGYKQLAIIYDKQKEYKKALDLTKKALEQGWNDECKKRIDRLEKKLSN